MDRPVAYVSHSLDHGGFLAVWLEDRPSCSKDQRDPDGWVSGVSGTDYEIARLLELVRAPGARVIRAHTTAAEWWARIERARKLKASKERNARTKGAQTSILIPEDVERDGRNASFERAQRKERIATGLRRRPSQSRGEAGDG